MQKLRLELSRNSLITKCNLFLRPHFGYCHIIHDSPNNESFSNLIENVQNNAAPAIAGAIRGSSQTKIYRKLGFESLKFRRLLRRFICSIKLKFLSCLNIYCLFSIDLGLITFNTQILLKPTIAEQICLKKNVRNFQNLNNIGI